MSFSRSALFCAEDPSFFRKLPFCCFIPVWRCLCPKAAARPMADHYPYGVKGQLLNNSLRGVAPAGLRKETIKMWSAHIKAHNPHHGILVLFREKP